MNPMLGDRAAGTDGARAAVSVAVVSTHGVGALRTTLHRLHETTGHSVEVVVLAAQHAKTSWPTSPATT